MGGLWGDEISQEKEVVHDSLGSENKESSEPCWLSDRKERSDYQPRTLPVDLGGLQ